jgi:chromosome segregation ATPase
LNIDLTQAQYKLDKLPELDETIKGLRGSLSAKENELDNMQKVAHQQSSDLQAHRSQIAGLQDENEQLSTQLGESVSHKVSAENELNSIKETFETLSSNVEMFGKENNVVKKELKETRDVANFWKCEAEEATLQIEQLTELERRLRQWVSDCEVSINKNKSSNENTTNKNEGLQQTVAEMGNTIDELMQELSYVNAVNSEFRKELSTPRYMSMGAITAKEGITMPLLKENLRKKFLGNSAPTLLKFKHKELA